MMAVEITEYMGLPIKKYKWWQKWVATTFGEPITGDIGNDVLYGYKWRGCLYVTEILTLPITVEKGH